MSGQPVGTPEALMDITDEDLVRAGQAMPTESADEEVHAPEPQGLERRFTKGEQIPWKGIWFEVLAVAPETLMLKPVGETWKHYKVRTGRPR